jgi:glutaredoxin-dependent peroxiredoxin
MSQINQPAPDFKLFNTSRKEVSLAELKGKNVVLLFFPLAFTSTCTAELCHIRDNYSLYNGLDATVFGISADSHYVLAKFKEEQKLNFDLLSDWNKEASTAYNCLYETFGAGMKGVPKRASFVIDKQGRIRHAEIQEKAGELPDFEAINSCLKSLN